ncbi:MAG: RHS repeat-associated core domain-containing protein [Bryobacteraceae bacterium]
MKVQAFIALIAATAGSVRLAAQAPAPSVRPDRGIRPGGAYHLSEIENVDVVSGNLNLSIPIAKLRPTPAGEPSFALSLHYNASQWDFGLAWGVRNNQTVVVYSLQKSPYGGWPAVGLTYMPIQEERPLAGETCTNAPTTAQFRSRASMVMPDGSVKALRLYGGQHFEDYYKYKLDGQPFCPGDTPLGGTVSWFTTDGSYLRLDVDAASKAWTLYFPDGSRVSGPSITSEADAIHDRNGNSVSIVNSIPSGLTKTFNGQNKTITITYPTVGNETTVSYPGFNSGNISTVIRQEDVVLQNLTYTDSNQLTTDVASPVVRRVTEVELPTGRKYQFTYHAPPNGKGELKQVTTPFSSTVEYAYHYTDNLFPLGLLGEVDNPVRQATLSESGSFSEVTFYDVMPASAGATSSKVRKPNGETEYFFRQRSTPSDPLRGLVYRTKNPDGSLTEREWVRNPPVSPNYGIPTGDPGNPFVRMEVRSLANTAGAAVKSAIVVSALDKNGNKRTVDEYWNTAPGSNGWFDFSAIARSSYGSAPILTGALPQSAGQYLRTTTRTYENPAGLFSDNSNSAFAYSNPGSSAIPFKRALKTETVSETVVGINSTRAATQYGYDNPATTANVNSVRRWDSEMAAAFSLPLGVANSIHEQATYGPGGRKETTTDARGTVTKYEYEPGPQPPHPYPNKMIQDSASGGIQLTTALGFDASSGLPTSSALWLDTSGNNKSTTVTIYDSVGRVKEVREAEGSAAERRTGITYDDASRRVVTRRDLFTVGDGVIREVAHYDSLGRQRLLRRLESSTESEVSESDGIKTETRYARSGNRDYELISNPYRTASDPKGWTLITRDGAGRILSRRHYTGEALPSEFGGGGTPTASATIAYDGACITQIDEANKTVSTAYDAFGRVAAVYEAAASCSGTASATYTYDVLDNLVFVQQGSQSRQFVYTSLSRLKTATNPETGAISYKYDPIGNLVSRTDARGTVCNGSWTGITCTANGYDRLNRVTKTTYSDSTPQIIYSYDSATNGRGRLASIGRAIYWTYYKSYDHLGRVTESQQDISESPVSQLFRFGYSYYRNDAPATMTLPSGRIVSYGVDGAGRVSTVGGTNSFVTSAAYAPHGPLAQVNLANGLTEAIGYDARLRPQFLSLRRTSNSTFHWSASLVYFPNGNVETASTSAGGSAYATQTFIYDSRNRLATATESGGGGWSRTYGYDVYGNRWLSAYTGIPPSTNTPTAAGAFNPANNRLKRFSPPTADNADGSGNLLEDLPYALTFDLDNRLTAATSVGNGSVTFSYDGLGQRVKKVTNGSSASYFAYDAFGRLAAEYDYSSPAPAACVTCYLTTDHLGSTRVISSQASAESGNIVGRYDYLPFGESIPSGFNGRAGLPCPGTSGCYGANLRVRQQFTAKERDAETGLDYFGARYLSAAQGRFTSPDEPLIDQHAEDPQSWNLYSYVRNNPLIFTDSTGNDCVYVNGAGNGIDSINNQNTSKDCGKTGGYWVDGTVTNARFAHGSLILTGTTDGTNKTSASYGLGPDPGLLALQRGTQLAAPAVNAAGTALAAGALVATVAVAGPAIASGTGLTTVNLTGAAQAAALVLPAGAKLAQMIARSGNSQFIGNPQAFLSFARQFVSTAISQGTYTAGTYISKAGSTIYRVGNDFMTVAKDGRILSYVQGANAGGVAAQYTQMGGK